MSHLHLPLVIPSHGLIFESNRPGIQANEIKEPIKGIQPLKNPQTWVDALKSLSVLSAQSFASKP